MAKLWAMIKTILKKTVPAHVLNIIWKFDIILKIPLFCNIAVTYCYFVFSRKKQQRLSWQELDRLQKRYYTPFNGIDVEYRKTTARNQIKRLLSLLPEGKKPDSLLETGAGHGFLSIIANREFNINSTATDLNFKENPELEKAQIPFEVMNVSKMSFDDSTFDCVVSFNAFEHFEQPETAIKEMIRITKSGGFVYLYFGPVYYAALGLHLYKSIHVPYSQYLFDYDMLMEYIEKNKITKYMPASFNYWKLEQYEQLWRSCLSQVDITYKRVTKDYRYLELVRAYPGLFKSKTNKFSDLTSTSIEILFKKK